MVMVILATGYIIDTVLCDPELERGSLGLALARWSKYLPTGTDSDSDSCQCIIIMQADSSSHTLGRWPPGIRLLYLTSDSLGTSEITANLLAIPHSPRCGTVLVLLQLDENVDKKYLESLIIDY